MKKQIISAIFIPPGFKYDFYILHLYGTILIDTFPFVKSLKNPLKDLFSYRSYCEDLPRMMQGLKSSDTELAF